MMHFFRTSTVHLDCFTYSGVAIKTAPIEKASRYMPEWFKNLPSQADVPNLVAPAPTMKYCTGVIDYYANSIGLPLWTELAVQVANGEYFWMYADQESSASIHQRNQYPGFLENAQYGHLKLMSPWLFSTKQDIKWMMAQPLYNYDHFRDFNILPGIVSFQTQPGTNIQLMLDVSKNKKFVVPHGQLLATYTPLTEKKIKIHRHLVTKDEHMRMGDELGTPPTFINSYRTFMNKQKQFSDCPFSRKDTK